MSAPAFTSDPALTVVSQPSTRGFDAAWRLDRAMDDFAGLADHEVGLYVDDVAAAAEVLENVVDAVRSGGTRSLASLRIAAEVTT